MVLDYDAEYYNNTTVPIPDVFFTIKPTDAKNRIEIFILIKFIFVTLLGN